MSESSPETGKRAAAGSLTMMTEPEEATVDPAEEDASTSAQVTASVDTEAVRDEDENKEVQTQLSTGSTGSSQRPSDAVAGRSKEEQWPKSSRRLEAATLKNRSLQSITEKPKTVDSNDSDFEQLTDSEQQVRRRSTRVQEPCHGYSPTEWKYVTGLK